VRYQGGTEHDRGAEPVLHSRRLWRKEPRGEQSSVIEAEDIRYSTVLLGV
jgi:hypothetical protein